MAMSQIQPVENYLSSRVNALELTPEGVKLLDQTALPGKVTYTMIRHAREMAEAIATMLLRGAPAIRIAGAYGVVLSARESFACDLALEGMRQRIAHDLQRLAKTRPTAVNLFWALQKMEAELLAPV